MNPGRTQGEEKPEPTREPDREGAKVGERDPRRPETAPPQRTGELGAPIAREALLAELAEGDCWSGWRRALGGDRVNPERCRFHELKEQLAEAEGCVVFEPGEIVSLKGQRFRIVDVAVTHVILRALKAEQGA